MKKLLFFIMAIVLFSFGISAQDISIEADKEANVYLQFLFENYEYIVPVLIWLVYRFVPTKQSDIIVKAINWLISLIPDKKKGGGTH